MTTEIKLPYLLLVLNVWGIGPESLATDHTQVTTQNPLSGFRVVSLNDPIKALPSFSYLSKLHGYTQDALRA